METGPVRLHGQPKGMLVRHMLLPLRAWPILLEARQKLFSLRALRRLLPGVHARADRCRQGHQRGALRIRLEATMLRGLHGLPALRRDRGLRLTPLTPSKI